MLSFPALESAMYDVMIRDNSTGETRTCPMPELEWHESSMFWWTEGNFACDCNRGLEFARAGGMTEAEIDALDEEADGRAFPCGDSRYTAVKAVFGDGREIPIDEDHKSSAVTSLSERK